MKQCHKKWQIYEWTADWEIRNQNVPLNLSLLITITIDFPVSADSQSQCLKLQVMDQLSQEQHTSPITLPKPYVLHLMALSPGPSHTISPGVSLLCFYCWLPRSKPNWLIYSTINWSRAVWLIKTCNRLQRERRRRGVGCSAANKMTLLDCPARSRRWGEAFDLYFFICW